MLIWCVFWATVSAVECSDAASLEAYFFDIICVPIIQG